MGIGLLAESVAGFVSGHAPGEKARSVKEGHTTRSKLNVNAHSSGGVNLTP